MSATALSSLVSRRDWENPAITHWHRLPAHAPMRSWRDENAARDDAASPARRLLNGEWRFSLFGSPEAYRNAG
ncbi:Beta-galactosidase (EC [Kosakonia radicincitans]|nr:Beta-galactosidase (EC [Kosakonia radicincitans]